jgi:hypothetical protein
MPMVMVVVHATGGGVGLAGVADSQPANMTASPRQIGIRIDNRNLIPLMSINGGERESVGRETYAGLELRLAAGVAHGQSTLGRLPRRTRR